MPSDPPPPEQFWLLHGLALVIERCARTGCDYAEVTAQVQSAVGAQRPAEGDCFAAFPPL